MLRWDCTYRFVLARAVRCLASRLLWLSHMHSLGCWQRFPHGPCLERIDSLAQPHIQHLQCGGQKISMNWLIDHSDHALCKHGIEAKVLSIQFTHPNLWCHKTLLLLSAHILLRKVGEHFAAQKIISSLSKQGTRTFLAGTWGYNTYFLISNIIWCTPT